MLAKLAFLLSLSAHHHHVVTGVYPTVEGTSAQLALSYPELDGTVYSYLDNFAVVDGRLLRDLRRRGLDMGIKVTIERDGDAGPWRVTKIGPID